MRCAHGTWYVYYCSICDISLSIDRGSMQIVEHQMICSPERKKQWSQNKCYESLLLHYPVINGNNLLTLLAALPPSSRPECVVLHFFSCFPHLCWVPTDFFPQRIAARALTPHPFCGPVPKSSGSTFLCGAQLFLNWKRITFSASALRMEEQSLGIL